MNAWQSSYLPSVHHVMSHVTRDRKFNMFFKLFYKFFHELFQLQQQFIHILFVMKLTLLADIVF